MALRPERARILDAARKQLGLDEPAWLDLINRIAGVRASNALSDEGFGLVVAELCRLGFVSTSPVMPLPPRPGMATPYDTMMIKANWLTATGGAGTERGLGRWLEQHFGVADLRFVTKAMAPKVIEGLLDWEDRNRNRKPRSAPAA